jgi:hypothetical protein
MEQKIRRGAPAVAPMPTRIDGDAILRVSDQAGRVIRSERLLARTDLRERLQVAHRNYALQGWTVGELRPGQWAFIAEKADHRLLIAIREASVGIAEVRAIATRGH